MSTTSRTGRALRGLRTLARTTSFEALRVPAYLGLVRAHAELASAGQTSGRRPEQVDSLLEAIEAIMVEIGVPDDA